MNEINERIAEVVRSTGRKEFSKMLGWSPQYLYRVLHHPVGLKPVTEILRAFPHISARWLILGEGLMTDRQEERALRHLAELLKE